MRTLSGMLSAIRLGGVEAFIELDSPEQRRGETMTGNVILIGGNEPQAVEWVTVSLVEHGSGQKGTYHKRIAKVEVPARTTMKPCGRCEVAFSLNVPINIKLSSQATNDASVSGCTVNVVAHLKVAMDARTRIPANIIPER